MNQVILTITGPSASGKSTLEQMLCAASNSVFEKVVSDTTRTPRVNEIDAEDYHFVTQAQFDHEHKAGNFAETVKFGGESYGAHKEEFARIFENGKIAVVVCEPNGRREIQNFAFQRDIACLTLFVTNPAHIRYRRLLDRFMKDISHLELGSPQTQVAISKFADRLAVVSEVEGKWSQDRSYSMNFSHFDVTNTASVLNHVSAVALNAMTRPGTAVGRVAQA